MLIGANRLIEGAAGLVEADSAMIFIHVWAGAFSSPKKPFKTEITAQDGQSCHQQAKIRIYSAL